MVTPNLPWELESEILSRVPPTSVKQLQLTCKRWYALFKDHIFIKNYLGKAGTQMILKNDESVYSFNFNFHGIHNGHDPIIEFTGKLKSLKDSKDVTIYKVFNCDGLLLCSTNNNRLVVWNPCTGQKRWIPSKLSSISYTRYFLGYGNNNKSCNNYKILSYTPCFRKYHPSVGKFEIYEFKSDSWRVVDGDWLSCCKAAVSLKGNTHWFLSKNNNPKNNSILRFDFTTEKFERLPHPCESDVPYKNVVLSSVREEKLAFLCQYYSGSTGSLKMKIWLTNTKTDEAKDLSWSEFFAVDFGKLMVDVMPGVTSFLVDEENKVMCCVADHDSEPITRIYIVGEDIYKNVYRDVVDVSRSTSTYPLLVSYVPSLVQIPKRQTNPSGNEKVGD